MNKSTPINLLPSAQQSGGQAPGQGQGQFINEQHRNLIAQAHNAAQNFTVPINTQLGGEYARDEDTTIQETLRHLNNSEPSKPKIQQLPPIQAMSSPIIQAQPQTQTHMQHQGQGQAYAPPTSSNQMQSMYGSPNIQGMDMFGTNQAGPNMSHSTVQESSGMWWFLGDLEDLKLAGVVVFLTLALAMLPISKAVQMYLPSALGTLPNADLVTRAILTGIVFYVTRGFLL